MRREIAERAGMAAVLGVLLTAAPAPAQHREYYVRGRVVDTAGQPIAGVEIVLRDASSSRAYHLETDDDGVFKFAGLPHAVYEVSVAKAGYAAMQDEWNLDAPQSSMKRMEMPDVVLVSQVQVQKAQHLKQVGAAAEEARDSIRSGDFDGALTLMRKVLQSDPDHSGALFLLGLSHAGKESWAEAVEALTRVTELSPDYPGAHLQLGVCHAKLGDAETALEHYDKTLELEPGNVTAAHNSGLILFESNRIEEALARFEAGLAANPDDPDLHEMAGRCYVHEADFQTAVEHLERARASTTDPGKMALLERLIGDLRSLIR